MDANFVEELLSGFVASGMVLVPFNLLHFGAKSFNLAGSLASFWTTESLICSACVAAFCTVYTVFVFVRRYVHHVEATIFHVNGVCSILDRTCIISELKSVVQTVLFAAYFSRCTGQLKSRAPFSMTA